MAKDKKKKGKGKAATKAAARRGARGLPPLEQSILRAKGVSAAQLARLAAVGLRSRQDFVTVGDAATLSQLCGMSEELARAVMSWASSGGRVVVETADVVYCVHCKTRQPKDYKAGDLCPACGKQAEPVLTCYWCTASGPGKFCRQCGARFVPAGELELALLLKREGVPKDEIPRKLEGLSDEEKDALWGRVRRPRG